MTSPRVLAWTRGGLRFSIGFVLLATAVGKLLDVEGFADVLRTYQAFSDWILFPLAVAVILVELLTAMWLFSGRNLFAAALVSAALHMTYAIWSAVSVLRGLRLANCGCFGALWPRPLNWSTVLEDGALVALSLLLALLSPRQT